MRNDAVQTYESKLPTMPDDLHKFVLVGREQVKAHKAKIRALQRVDEGYAARKAALEDGQQVAEIVIDAEAKLGELLAAIPPRFHQENHGKIVGEKTLPPSITKKESHQAQVVAKNPDVVEQVKQKAKSEGRLATSQEVYREVKKKKPKEPNEERKGSTFNETNENIEWARWTWNPVTGCQHGCRYCYARDIAHRFYKEKFKPTFYPHRLKAPSNTPFPEKINVVGDKNVFVCSMADLFGSWVPQEWIDKILNAVRNNPKWNFIFLTKNPERLTEIEWPDNAWVGTTVDVQGRVKRAEEAFRNIYAPVKFISCEPLTETLTFSHLDRFDWVIIGAQSKSTQAPAIQPDLRWVIDLMDQAENAGCKVYLKPNLTVVKEYP